MTNFPVDAPRIIASLKRGLPRGRAIPAADWARRHKQLLAVLWLHVPGVPLFGLLMGWPLLHSFEDMGVIAACAALATSGRLGRTMRTLLVTIGLLGTSMMMVHLGHGDTTMHFHFFVAIAFLSLYGEWLPFLVALAMVVFHHGVLGVLEPQSIYDHQAAFSNPWGWALVHGLFVLAASLANLTGWHYIERAHSEAEDELRRALDIEHQAVERLTELDRARNDFVSTVSHELRTPLTSMLGYLELFSDGDLGEVSDDAHHALGVMERNARRLNGMVEDLLAVSTDLGASGHSTRRLDLAELTGAAVRRYQIAALAGGLKLEADVRKAEVDGDAELLDRLLGNLLTNALKFSHPGGEVGVRVARIRESVVLEVADTGIGIPVEEQHLLFSRFFRSSLSRQSEIQGPGLGLVVVNRIVELHQGTIGVTSSPGVGTTVTVTLPAPADARPTLTAVPGEALLVASVPERAASVA
jgi:signal transduction histidine kinase